MPEKPMRKYWDEDFERVAADISMSIYSNYESLIYLQTLNCKAAAVATEKTL